MQPWRSGAHLSPARLVGGAALLRALSLALTMLDQWADYCSKRTEVRP